MVKFGINRISLPYSILFTFNYWVKQEKLAIMNDIKAFIYSYIILDFFWVLFIAEEGTLIKRLHNKLNKIHTHTHTHIYGSSKTSQIHPSKGVSRSILSKDDGGGSVRTRDHRGDRTYSTQPGSLLYLTYLCKMLVTWELYSVLVTRTQTNILLTCVKSYWLPSMVPRG